MNYYVRALRNWKALVVVAIAAGLAVSDWPIGFWNDFWTGHVIIAGVVTSALLGALVAVVVDDARAARQLDAWRRVRDIAYKVLMESLEYSRDVLDLLGRGEFYYGNRPAFALPFEQQLRSRVIDVVPASPTERISRLECLMGDGEWLDTAYRLIRLTKEEARRSLGQWSAVIVELPRHTARFRDAALIADALEELQRPFHPVHRVQGGIATGERRFLAAALCDEIITTSVAIEEVLWHEMGRPGWRSRARLHLLSERGKAEIDDPLDHRIEYLAELCAAVRHQYESSFEVLRERSISDENQS